MPKVSRPSPGQARSGGVPDNTLLVDYIRENLRLTGTHVGCDTSTMRRVRRACRMAKSVKSLHDMLAVSAQRSAEVTTIEGVAAAKGETASRCRWRSRTTTACSAGSARQA